MTFVSCHVGAGFHKSEGKYDKCLSDSIEAGNRVLKNGGSALDAVSAVIEVLENDGITNCGRGSALNLNCEVQCDASLMQSNDLLWAGIGSVSKIKNPILAAKCLLLSQQKKHPDGLINACFLVADGARKWALEHGCLESDNLITDQTLDLFEKHRLEITKLKDETIKLTINEQFKSIKKRKLEESTSSKLIKDTILIDHGYLKASSIESSDAESDLDQKILDTVGAIAIDKFGNVASAVSSGGIMFKDPDRIGQAAVYGAGCFAEDNVAVTTTGVGEYLIKTLFAKKCTSKLLKADKQIESKDQFDSFAFDNVIKKTFIENFVHSKYLKTSDHDKLIGVLSLVANKEFEKVQLIWAHNTPSMFIAYSTDKCEEVKKVFSRISGSKDHIEAKSILIDL